MKKNKVVLKVYSRDVIRKQYLEKRSIHCRSLEHFRAHLAIRTNETPKKNGGRYKNEHKIYSHSVA